MAGVSWGDPGALNLCWQPEQLPRPHERISAQSPQQLRPVLEGSGDTNSTWSERQMPQGKEEQV